MILIEKKRPLKGAKNMTISFGRIFLQFCAKLPWEDFREKSHVFTGTKLQVSPVTLIFTAKKIPSMSLCFLGPQSLFLRNFSATRKIPSSSDSSVEFIQMKNLCADKSSAIFSCGLTIEVSTYMFGCEEIKNYSE